MTTLAEAIDASLDANWSGAGGAEPTIDNSQNVLGDYLEVMAATEFIYIEGYTLKERLVRAVNDIYSHMAYTISFVCSTADTTDTEDRLNEIVNEARRILMTDGAITGYDIVRWLGADRSITPQDRHVYRARCTVELHNLMEEGAIGSGSGTTYYMGAALMLGSANAAWVPCQLITEDVAASVVASSTFIANAGATDSSLVFELPLPTAKGSLKLYITGCRVDLYDADAGDYITRVIVRGMTHLVYTALMTDNTDLTAQQRKDYVIAATDCSVYGVVRIEILGFFTTLAEVKISGVSLQCYYDT